MDNLHYDYFWMIEDDVCFSGSWDTLFKAYQDDTSDFISTGVYKFEEKPDWYWWFSLKTNNLQIHEKSRIKSFNPIYRLSKRALELINRSLKNGWSGHHEVLIPTLLYNNGFSITDMGGGGSFAPLRFKKPILY